MTTPEVTHHFSDGTYIRQGDIPAGTKMVGHKHVYDHFSILAQGRALVEVDGTLTEYNAPTLVVIGKERHHEITAMTDIVWFCIHATTETDAEALKLELVLEN